MAESRSSRVPRAGEAVLGSGWVQMVKVLSAGQGTGSEPSMGKEAREVYDLPSVSV